MDSYTSASSGQRALAFLAYGNQDPVAQCLSTNRHASRLLPKRLAANVSGVGTATAALHLAQEYAHGKPAPQAVKTAGIQTVQTICAMNASTALAKLFTDYPATKNIPYDIVYRIPLLLVLVTYDVRTFFVERWGAEGPIDRGFTHKGLNDLKSSVKLNLSLFVLMLWPTGQAVVRACVGWCMLRTASTATARLVFGQRGYSQVSRLLTEVEATLNGFLSLLSLPLALATFIVGTCARMLYSCARVAVSGLKRMLVGVCSGTFSLLSARRRSPGEED